MRNTIIITTAVVLACSAQIANAEPTREEHIGVGTGAIIGALAGGPVGFVIGAAVGGKLGDTIGNKSNQIASLESSLNNSEQSVASLEQGIDRMSSEIERLQSNTNPELVSLMQAGIDMDLLFRTDEHVLTDTTGDRLAQMAGTLSAMPGVQIKLDGFADERGDEKYNHELSEKRVEFVRNLFIASGVHPSRISTSAHGESVAQAPDSDSYALERRVSVKLFIDNAEAVASNPR